MGRLRKFIQRHPILARIFFFFPVQLVLVQLKKNPVLILFWLVLFGFITGKIASTYGIYYLFVDPEYQGEVGFLSYFITGFAAGGFIMAYQISAYIHNAFRFPFLATVSRPFMKFCMNNSILPTAFLITYLYQIVSFLKKEPVTATDIMTDISGFISGVILFITGSLLYFFRAGKDLTSLYGISEEFKATRIKRIIPFRHPKSKEITWRELHTGKEARDWHVETYFISFFRIRRARPFEHYDKELINRVFRQNHGRAVLFEILVIVTLLVMGLFRSAETFLIPAGASILLLFTLYLMFSGILATWFRGWANLLSILLLVALNWAAQFNLTGNQTKAYGLDYSGAPVKYDLKTITSLSGNRTDLYNDSLNEIKHLENWYRNNVTDSTQKPKLVIISCSGGGLRSALWSYYMIHQLDSLCGDDLMSRTALMCGSSGGMLGAAYYREMYLRDEISGKNSRHSSRSFSNISADILNPIAFSVAVNDWFLPVRKFTYANQRYSSNRAYAFEQALHQNTDNVLEKTLSDYQLPEIEAKIPMMILAPTIANDGRKLIISAQPVSFLTSSERIPGLNFQESIDAVEYSKLFSDRSPGHLRFSSALRMSATFPYITPLTELPTDPALQVFDAGMRDNFGTGNIIRYVNTFKRWLEEHTSGIIVLQFRDKAKLTEPEAPGNSTIINSLTKPLGSFYGNLFRVQDYTNDRELILSASSTDLPVDILDFEIYNEEPDRISLSWHLTGREKARVISSARSTHNTENIKRFRELIK